MVPAHVRPSHVVGGALSAAFFAAAVGSACSVGTPTAAGGDGGLEASMSDVSEDVAPTDGSTCQPGNVQTYVPNPYRPATPPWQGVCSTRQITDFYTACLDPSATAASCYSFSQSPTTAACASCILTPEAATTYGPLIDHGSFITENVGGCIELTDSSGLTCAKAQQALEGCQLAACEAPCPVHNAADRAAYDACAVAATTSGCQQYQSKATCALDAPEGGPSSMCVRQTFEGFYDYAALLFCGPPPDAAAPPFEAGAADARAADGPGSDAPSPDAASSDAPPGEASTSDAPQSDGPAEATPD